LQSFDLVFSIWLIFTFSLFFYFFSFFKDVLHQVTAVFPAIIYVGVWCSKENPGKLLHSLSFLAKNNHVMETVR